MTLVSVTSDTDVDPDRGVLIFFPRWVLPSSVLLVLRSGVEVPTAAVQVLLVRSGAVPVESTVVPVQAVPVVAPVLVEALPVAAGYTVAVLAVVPLC